MASSVLRARPLLLSCLLLLASHCPGAAEDVRFIKNSCDPSFGKYTRNSTFKTNLDHLLSSLSSETPDSTGYSSTTVGQTPDQVYGLAMCRGDLTADKCRDCLATAVPDVVQKCPYIKDATVWYDPCLLRYSSKNFSGRAISNEFWQNNPENVSDTATFEPLLGRLLNQLTLRATSSPRLFAAGEVDVTSFSKIYALVQCTRDISVNDCTWCLSEEIGNLPNCCASRKGAKVIGRSCYLWYEAFLFYNSSAADDLPAPLNPAPSGSPPLPSTTAASGKKDNASGTILIMVISIPPVIGLAAIMAAICKICLRRRKRRRNILDGGGGSEKIGQFESLLFELETLKIATENFSDSNKLGEGGFGVVYKGVLRDMVSK